MTEKTITTTLGGTLTGTNFELTSLVDHKNFLDDIDLGDIDEDWLNDLDDSDSESDDSDNEPDDSDSEGDGTDDEGDEADSEGDEGDGTGDEGDDSDTESDDSDTESDDSDSEGDDSDSEGDDSDSEGDDSDSEGDDSDTESDEADSESDETGDEADSEGDEADSEGDEADSEGDDGSDEADSEGDDSDSESDSDEAGGHNDDVADDDGNVFDDLIDSLRADADTDLKDNNEALKEAVWGETDNECLENEQVWRPYHPELDKVVRPRGDYTRASAMRDEVRTLTAAIRAQFRAKFLAARRPVAFHGVRRGRDLSERRLVDTMIEIKSGVRPTRPDYKIKHGDDCSLAVAVVGDQSGSMWGREAKYAGMAMMAVADAFDSLGSPVMCCGVRDGSRPQWGSGHVDLTSPDGQSIDSHRDYPVKYDVFKDWHESMRTKKVVSRFSAYKATGSTPLSDGVAFALESLSERPERHRVVLVLTDGCPNNSEVMNRLVRLAREAGIWVIGVGIGYGMGSVRTLYPDKSIVCEDFTTMPRDLVDVLETIVFPKRGGQKVALDGKVAAG